MSLSMMLKSTVHQAKLLLLLLLDLIFYIYKYLKYKVTGKHEIERIFESQTDIYQKTLLIDQWLERTKCKPVSRFCEENLSRQSKEGYPTWALDKILSSYIVGKREKSEPTPSRSEEDTNLSRRFNSDRNQGGDIILSDVLTTLTDELFHIIKKQKHLGRRFKHDYILRDTLYRIISYRITLFITEQLAATRYDSDQEAHIDKLVSLWNNLVRADRQVSSIGDSINDKVFPSEISSEIDKKSDVVSKRWSHIGFQGEDPGTDFRGMGLLGLTQLEYLSRRPKNLARDLLQRSLNEQHTYPFAIVGINITYNLLNLFRDGSMKHLYYDTGDILFRNDQRTLSCLRTFNDIYVELYLRFDCFWHESKPETILEFKGLMEQFISVIRMDLYNRNFSLKFIY